MEEGLAESCTITYRVRCRKTGVKGDDAGLLCILTVMVLSLHVIFLLFLIICHGATLTQRQLNKLDNIEVFKQF